MRIKTYASRSVFAAFETGRSTVTPHLLADVLADAASRPSHKHRSHLQSHKPDGRLKHGKEKA